MDPDQLEALWASQPQPAASSADLVRAIRPELNRRSRMIGYAVFANGLAVLLFPLLTVINYRHNPARYATAWHIAQDLLQLVVIVLWAAYALRRLREHRALRQRQTDSVRAATEVSLANLEAQMKDSTMWRKPLMGLTLLSLATSLVLVGVNHQSWAVGLRATLATGALLAVIGLVEWRHYRVNLLPAYTRQKALLAQLS